MRSRALLPLRRDRREPGRAIQDGGRKDVAGGLAAGGERAVHLHHLPARDAARGGEVLRRPVHAQEQQRRLRAPRGRDGVRAGEHAAVKWIRGTRSGEAVKWRSKELEFPVAWRVDIFLTEGKGDRG